MLLSIDSASERPIYEQITDGVRRAVVRGELRVGEKLPPASEVAIGLGVNKHTVLHAYQVLRDEGLIDLRRGRGAVVTHAVTRIAELQADVQALVERAVARGIGPGVLTAMIEGSDPPPATGKRRREDRQREEPPPRERGRQTEGAA